MLEPILSLHLASAVGLSPSRVGLVFGAGAVAAAVLHPFFGHLADRRGGRSVTLAGLVIVGAMLPLMGRATSFETAIGFYLLQAIAIGVVATGGGALGWLAAFGGLAVARSYAIGGLAIAEHTNDAAANQLVEESRLFALANAVMEHSGWFLLLASLPPLSFFVKRLRRDMP